MFIFRMISMGSTRIIELGAARGKAEGIVELCAAAAAPPPPTFC